MGEAVQEPGAAVQLDQQGDDRGEGQQFSQLCLQHLGLGWDVLGGQRRNDQLPVFAQAHRPDAQGQYSLEVGQRSAQLGVGLCQLGRGVGGLSDQLAELKPKPLPCLRLEQAWRPDRSRAGNRFASWCSSVSAQRCSPVDRNLCGSVAMRTSSADVRSRASAYASCHIAQVSFSAGCVVGSGADGREHQARLGIGPRLLECLKENVGEWAPDTP